MRTQRLVAAAFAAMLPLAAAAARGEPPRLFDGEEPLEIELEADWDPIRRDDSPKPAQHPGVLTYQGPDGPVRIPLRVAASGRSRRTQDICELPPLRLDLPKRERKGTLFRGIGELKLTTHCRHTTKYEQYVVLEYLAYRAYAALTDWSHRVRLLRVTYREPGGGPRWQRLAFAIEDASDLAKRVGATRVRESAVARASLDDAAASRAELFFYMVGMTDFSLIRRLGGPCCHNVRALRRGDGRVVPVPYDFDQTGVVNPEYAAPNARLGIRFVTQRKFRGQCRAQPTVDATLALLREKRAAVRALFESQRELSARSRQRALAYLASFDRWADDPAAVAKTLSAECAQVAR